MSGAKIIRSCATINEAVIVASLLREGGFDASIDNFYHASLEWWMIRSFGGVYVRVPETQLIPAGEYMLNAVASADDRLITATGTQYVPTERTRHLVAWSMLFLWTGAAYIFLIPIGVAIFWLIEALIPAHWVIPSAPIPHHPMPQIDNGTLYEPGILILTTGVSERPGSWFNLNISAEGIVFFGIFFCFLFFEFAYLSQLPKVSNEKDAL